MSRVGTTTIVRRFGRHAIAEFQARQDRRTEPARHDPVHDCDRHIHRRDQSEERQETQRPAADRRLAQRDQRQQQNDRCDHEDAADIPADADLRVGNEQANPASAPEIRPSSQRWDARRQSDDNRDHARDCRSDRLLGTSAASDRRRQEGLPAQFPVPSVSSRAPAPRSRVR